MALPDKNYSSKEFLYKGQLILRLYDYSCVVCGYAKDWMEIHHIDKMNDNNEWQNLVPVCKDCHMIVHSKRFRLKLEMDFFVLQKCLLIEDILNHPPITRK